MQDVDVPCLALVPESRCISPIVTFCSEAERTAVLEACGSHAVVGTVTGLVNVVEDSADRASSKIVFVGMLRSEELFCRYAKLYETLPGEGCGHELHASPKSATLARTQSRSELHPRDIFLQLSSAQCLHALEIDWLHV